MTFFTPYYYADGYFRYLVGAGGEAIAGTISIAFAVSTPVIAGVETFSGAIAVAPEPSMSAIVGSQEQEWWSGYVRPTRRRILVPVKQEAIPVAVIGSIGVGFSVSVPAMTGQIDTLAAIQADDEEWFLLEGVA